MIHVCLFTTEILLLSVVVVLSSCVAMSPYVHCTALLLFDNFTTGIDYRKLMSGEQPLSLLTPALTSSNVHSVARLANLIPMKVSWLVIRLFLVSLIQYQIALGTIFSLFSYFSWFFYGQQNFSLQICGGGQGIKIFINYIVESLNSGHFGITPLCTF